MATQQTQEKIKTSHITSSVKLNEVVFEGITYTKIMRAPQSYKYKTDAGKHDCSLWICVEAESKLPAKMMLVPEIL